MRQKNGKQKTSDQILLEKLYSRLNILRVHEPKKNDNPLLKPIEPTLVSKSISNRNSLYPRKKLLGKRKLKTQMSHCDAINQGMIRVHTEQKCIMGKTYAKFLHSKDKMSTLISNQGRNGSNNYHCVEQRKDMRKIVSSGRIASAFDKREKKRYHDRKKKSELVQPFKGWEINDQDIEQMFH